MRNLLRFVGYMPCPFLLPAECHIVSTRGSTTRHQGVVVSWRWHIGVWRHMIASYRVVGHYGNLAGARWLGIYLAVTRRIALLRDPSKLSLRPVLPRQPINRTNFVSISKCICISAAVLTALNCHGGAVVVFYMLCRISWSLRCCYNHSRSFKVTDFCTNWKPTCHFLLANNTNLDLLRTISSYCGLFVTFLLLTEEFLSLPHSFAVTPQLTATKVDTRKLEMSLYSAARKVFRYFWYLRRFGVVHRCDTRTDRQVAVSNSAV